MDVFSRFRRISRTLTSMQLYQKSSSYAIQEKINLRHYCQSVQNRFNIRNHVRIMPAFSQYSQPLFHDIYNKNNISCLRYSGKTFSTLPEKDSDIDSESLDQDRTDTADNEQSKDHRVNINDLVSRLLNQAAGVDVMVKSIPERKVHKDITELIDAGFPASKLDILCSSPKVFFDIPRFTELVKVLYDLGYKQKNITAMFKCKPSLMNSSANTVAESFKRLHSVGLRSKGIVKITTECPAILDVDLQTIQTKIAELRELFKTADVFALIVKHPHVLNESMDLLNEKYAYVVHEMGITQRQMMKSNLFSLSLEHLHTRHMYALRTGFFKKRKSEEQISTNPSLDKMIDSTDEEFVEKFGGLSIEEYEVFKALLKREQIINVEDEDT